MFIPGHVHDSIFCRGVNVLIIIIIRHGSSAC